MAPVKLLAFSGSTRRDSFNQKLVQVVAQGAREAGAEVNVVSLRDFPMPLYDGDLEAEKGLPEKAKEFKKLMRESDGFLIASPEYNSSFTGVLKNALDWVSRAEEKGEPGLVAFAGKVAGLVSASPGALGGLRGLVHLRSMLENIQVHVIPDQFALSSANQAIDEQGSLKDPAQERKAKGIGAKTADIAARLRG